MRTEFPMQTESLFLAYALVVTAVAISWYHHLKIERDLLLSSLRATLQLIAVGFVLEAVLTIEEPLYLFAILLFMCAVAGVVSGGRGKRIPHARKIAFLAIALGSGCTFATLYAAGVIQPEARYAIPLGGMIVGNAMKASSLSLNRLIAEVSGKRPQIENLLALGASKSQAAADAVRQAVKAALIPTIDTMKTVGLVHLPGIMTGFIIAGGSPLTAVKYQLAVIYMIAGATAVTCLLVTLLASRRCITNDLQLADAFRPADEKG